MIRFTVLGKPQPAGSKRAFALKRRDGSPVTRANGSQVVTVVDANPNAKDWKNSVRCAAREVYSGELLTGPICFECVFYRPRPKSHYRSGARSHELKDGMDRALPTSKPDVLKLARGVEDALTGVLWVDDAQICNESLRKEYGEPARVEISVQQFTKCLGI